MIKLLAFLLLSPMVFAKTVNFTSEGQKLVLEDVVERSDVIWGLDFISAQEFLFTERGGRLFHYHQGTKKLTEVKGVPKVYHEGQGGLLDVRVDPDFKKNQLVFLTYAEPVNDKRATTALLKAKLINLELKDQKVIFRALDPNTNSIHFGSRLEFDGKGNLYLTVGDRYERDKAQSLANHQGKVLRLDYEGAPTKGNPFIGKKDARPEIYSYGHRNPQGLALHPVTGELWEAEFGPQGGDEVNIVLPGKNYGWPVVTSGIDYDGSKIAEASSKPGMEQPFVHWVPAISPSGLEIYQGDKMSKWNGNLFLANLGTLHVRRVVLEGKKVVKQEELFKDLNYRFRFLRQGPDNFLYLTTDEGKILRVRPL